MLPWIALKGYVKTRHGLTLLFFLAVFFAAAAGICSDDLTVVKDKEGTTWSVGSGQSREKAQAEEDRDKDRAWDMLKNQSIIIDKRKQEK